MNREDLCLKIAELHLKRVEVLQTVEWRIAISLWTFVAGVAMVSLVNADKVKQVAIALGSPWSSITLIFVFLVYAILGWLYVWQFCKENYNSLVTERNRYQRMQNEAVKYVLKGKASDFLILINTKAECWEEPSFKKLAGNAFVKTGIWQFKVAVTAALMLFSFAIIAMIFLSTTDKHLNDSVAATGQPAGWQLKCLGGNVSR